MTPRCGATVRPRRDGSGSPCVMRLGHPGPHRSVLPKPSTGHPSGCCGQWHAGTHEDYLASRRTGPVERHIRTESEQAEWDDYRVRYRREWTRRKHGHTPSLTFDLSPEGRFWSHAVGNLNSGCIEWQGSLNKWGRPQVHWRGRTRIAYRVAYQLVVGPIPAGMTLDHLCRNRICVNPNHLEPVPLLENIQRDIAARALDRAVVHDHFNHGEYDEDPRFRLSGADEAVLRALEESW